RRQLFHRREVRRLVELAAVRGAVAEEHDDDPAGLAHLLGERDADADHEIAPEGTALAENTPGRVDDVHHAALAPICAAFLEGDVAKDLFGGKPTRDPVGEATMTIQHRIVGPQSGQRRDLTSLLAGARVESRRQLTRHRELTNALLEPPR